MRCVSLVTSAILVAGLATSASASTSTIGAFFDAEATDCDIEVAPFSEFNVYVSAVLGTDAAGAGFLGAEFRVDGLSDIVLSFSPNPASSLSLGDPTGIFCDIVFPVCMTGEGAHRVVLLYTITCTVTFPVMPRTVTVMRHLIPCDSCFPCRFAPCITLCDDPVFTQVLVPGGQALINNGACTVEVPPSTWGHVKSLYQG